MSDKKTALAVLSATPAKVKNVHFLKRTGKAVEKRLGKIFRTEFEAAFNAVAVGVMLWQVKVASKHGTFQPWIKEHCGERAYRSAAYYMKLAVKFAEKAKLTAEECIAVAELKTKAPKGGPAKSAFDKLETFIGENSLTDLLIKHSIRSGSGAGEIESSDDGAPAALPAGGEQLMFAEISGHLFGLRESVLKPENIMRLEPKQLEALKTEIEHTRTEFLKLYEQARGKK
jgi:hypothetical protein